jgi:hypothetical protein
MVDHALRADIARADTDEIGGRHLGPIRLMSPAALARAKEREYWAMYYASIPVFLLVAALLRLIPTGAGYHSAFEAPKRSVFAEASHMAHTIIPFAFWR